MDSVDFTFTDRIPSAKNSSAGFVRFSKTEANVIVFVFIATKLVLRLYKFLFILLMPFIN